MANLEIFILEWSLFDEILAVTAPAAARKFWGLWAIERACPTQRLLREPPLHSGYCGSLADTLSIHRPSPEPTTLPVDSRYSGVDSGEYEDPIGYPDKHSGPLIAPLCLTALPHAAPSLPS